MGVFLKSRMKFKPEPIHINLNTSPLPSVTQAPTADKRRSVEMESETLHHGLAASGPTN